MIFIPAFPTALHKDTAEVARDYFSPLQNIDTVLIVNSCARGQAVAESDLDIAVLVKPATTLMEIKNMESAWLKYFNNEPTIIKYKQSGPFALLHLDIFDGSYVPAIIKKGEPIDNFEIEIGNQISYSAPMGTAGPYFKELQQKWLPYYAAKLRLQRLQMVRDACEYDISHISFFIKRGLHFQAFDTLYRAFQKYLQALFIANKTYPVAYNKWIKEQVVEWLDSPELYSRLSPVLSITNFESNEINNKAEMLRKLLDDVKNE